MYERKGSLWVPCQKSRLLGGCSIFGITDMMMGGSSLKEVTFKVWGAGGGNRYTNTTGFGGAGGYASYTGLFDPGTTLYFVVGFAGGYGNGAGGGGYSGVFTSSSLSQASALVVAGAGGGAAGGANGGAGGGATGGQGTADALGSGAGGGKGGTQSYGGAVGGGALLGGNTSGNSGIGGWPGGGSGWDNPGAASDGGGGAGWFGGGAGGAATGSQAGGGGSSWTANGAILGGSATTPGNAADPDRKGEAANDRDGLIVVYVDGVLYGRFGVAFAGAEGKEVQAFVVPSGVSGNQGTLSAGDIVETLGTTDGNPASYPGQLFNRRVTDNSYHSYVPGWAGVRYGAPKVINKVGIYPRSIDTGTLLGRSPGDFLIQASNNGTDWITLHSVTGASYSRYVTNWWAFSNSTPYSYYRMYCSRTAESGGTLNFSELIFVEA